MNAPTYRNLDTASTLLGLSFPTEALLVLAGFWGSMLTLPPGLALLVTLALYVGGRIVAYGRAPLFLQHALMFQLRQHLYVGSLSAAARSRTPQFPYAALQSRDAGRGPAGGKRKRAASTVDRQRSTHERASTLDARPSTHGEA